MNPRIICLFWEYIYEPIWQQDGAPAHRDSRTIQWLTDRGIHRLKWPACSPDLSQIEEVWSVLVQKVRKLDMPKNKMELQNIVMNLWDDIDQSLLERLAKHFKANCRMVIELKGDLINKFYL